MGVVYSSLEIAQAEIPLHGSHCAAANSVIEQIPELPGVDLTVVHGSVVNGNSNIRSDLDVLVTYTFGSSSEEPVITRSISTVLDNISEQTRVKIEANVWPGDEHPDARRERMYDLLFSRHLARSMSDPKWAIGEPDQSVLDVAESSYIDNEGLRNVALNYTTYKHAGFVKAPREFSESDRVLSALQRAFEFPKSTGRKIGQMLGFDEDASPEDNWSMLVHSGLGGEARDAMIELQAFDTEYTKMVEAAEDIIKIPGWIDPGTYYHWLEKIYPTAMDLGIIAASGFISYVAEGK